MSAPRISPRVVVAVWATLLALCLWECRSLGFDSNILRMDGTEQSILSGERRFFEAWGQGDTNRAIVVCEGPTAEDAQEVSDDVDRAVRAAGVGTGGSTLSALWPSQRTRAENLVRWQSFWSPGRIKQLRQTLAQEGEAFGFATNAFDPFLDGLAGAPCVHEGTLTNGLLARLRGEFLQQKGVGWQCLSFYPDTETLRTLVKGRDGNGHRVLIVSPQTLAGDLSSIFASEIIRISAVAVVIILLVTLGLVRDVRVLVISLIPSVSAVATLLAVMAVGGRMVNMANVFAGIVVFGLSLDYGFIMMHSYQHRLTDDARISVHVSAITTVIGTAALLFARHPVLLSLGITLTIGILAGYVTAMWVVPALYALWIEPRREGTG